MVGAPEGEVKFFQWPARKLIEIWPMIKGYAQKLIERASPKITGEDFFDNLVTGKWQLWIAWVPQEKKVLAIMVTELLTYKNGEKDAHMIFVTGDHRSKWENLVLPTIEQWAIKEGCTYQSGWCRPGWEPFARQFGFKKTHVLIEKRLKPSVEVNDDGRRQGRRQPDHGTEVGSVGRGEALSS